MWRVPSDLLQVAERIAQAENRIGKLRLRVERLKEEGSDATRAEELLNNVAATLGHLYAHQSDLRRSAWVISK
jgi:hypothetical protein